MYKALIHGVRAVRRRAVRAGRHRGRAVQVAPIKPKLKSPGTKRLKLNHDDLLSNVGSILLSSLTCAATSWAGTWRCGRRSTPTDRYRPWWTTSWRPR